MGAHERCKPVEDLTDEQIKPAANLPMTRWFHSKLLVVTGPRTPRQRLSIGSLRAHDSTTRTPSARQYLARLPSESSPCRGLFEHVFAVFSARHYGSYLPFRRWPRFSLCHYSESLIEAWAFIFFATHRMVPEHWPVSCRRPCSRSWSSFSPYCY